MRTILIASFFASLTAVASVAAASALLPLQEMRRQAFITIDGAAVDRYQWRFVSDQRDTGTCVLVLTDAETGRFAITAVGSQACQ